MQEILLFWQHTSQKTRVDALNIAREQRKPPAIPRHLWLNFACDTVDGRNPVSPKKPWFLIRFSCNYRQTLGFQPWFRRWCVFWIPQPSTVGVSLSRNRTGSPKWHSLDSLAGGSKLMVPFWGRCTSILVYLSGDWDVHWACGVLTHGQLRDTDRGYGQGHSSGPRSRRPGRRGAGAARVVCREEGGRAAVARCAFFWQGNWWCNQNTFTHIHMCLACFF